MASARAPLVILAAKPGAPCHQNRSVFDKPNRPKTHSEAEWDAVYPQIQRLYIRERRKLRYVMTRLEEDRGFYASPQMYKKRFTKWGFFKNTRRLRPVDLPPGKEASESHSRCLNATGPQSVSSQIRLNSIPQMSRADTVLLTFFTNIRTWNNNFFETVKQPSSPDSDGESPLSLFLPYFDESQPYDPEKISMSFKLIADLLLRGQGLLAGRLARKAFLQAEQMLRLEGPLFIWNLLEILHSVMHLKQDRLYDILIAHLMSLARSRYKKSHAIVQMLYGLRHLSETSTGNITHILPTILERGWSLNADLVLSNFSERFLLLYYRLMWNSPLLKLSEDNLQNADAWFAMMKPKIPLDAIRKGSVRLHPALEFTPPYARCDPPANYERLKDRTIEDLQQRIEVKTYGPDSHFRLLSALMKSRILSDGFGVLDSSEWEHCCGIGDSSQINIKPVRPGTSHLQTRILAFLMGVLTNLDLEHGVDTDAVIERMKDSIGLRDYGEGIAAPQVIADMRRLRNLLASKGRTKESRQLGHEADRRLELYLWDIPVDVVEEVI